MTRSMRARIRAFSVALAATVALASGAGLSALAGQTGTEPSDVVLVFDVSNSILRSTDGTNGEFADALEGIADRVEVVADDLASGNAKISFVVFGRTAVPYPAKCGQLDLHDNPAAIARFEACLRLIAGEYRAGAKAKVQDRVNTQDTDHVAALVEASKLLPAASTRSAVIFFTDGEHDPPGTARDNENVVAKATPAFAGRTPLAVLPVGLGSRAGDFESELTSIYKAFFRDMQPCEGRASFVWPQVVFPSADNAGTAVALALQEVTCSFTVAPTPTPVPTPRPPTAPPPSFQAPHGVLVRAGDRSLAIQWAAPSGSESKDYVVRCTPVSGGDPIESDEGLSSARETTITDLQPGTAYMCEVAATDGTTVGPWSAPSAAVVVLGIPAAPSQPRVELLDAAARLSVDGPTAGTTPIEQYLFNCTDTAGKVVEGQASTPTVVVDGLTNGDTFQCVAYAQNSVGRSPASPPTASFSPCGGLLSCNPLLAVGIVGVVLATVAVLVALFARRYRRRNRVWVTAQVDGGENRPLGWGPEIGIRLVADEGGWFAAALPEDSVAPVQVRYRGENRFVVAEGKHIVDVHQGDPTTVTDEAGKLHQLILRRYGDKPSDRTAVRAAPSGAAGSPELATRLPGREAPAAERVAGAEEPEGAGSAEGAATPDGAATPEVAKAVGEAAGPIADPTTPEA